MWKSFHKTTYSASEILKMPLSFLTVRQLSRSVYISALAPADMTFFWGYHYQSAHLLWKECAECCSCCIQNLYSTGSRDLRHISQQTMCNPESFIHREIYPPHKTKIHNTKSSWKEIQIHQNLAFCDI